MAGNLKTGGTLRARLARASGAAQEAYAATGRAPTTNPKRRETVTRRGQGR